MKPMVTRRLLRLCLLGPALSLGCGNTRQEGPATFYWFPQASSGASSTSSSKPSVGYLTSYPESGQPQTAPYAQTAQGSPYRQVPAHLTVPDPALAAAPAKPPQPPSSPAVVAPAANPQPPAQNRPPAAPAPPPQSAAVPAPTGVTPPEAAKPTPAPTEGPRQMPTGPPPPVPVTDPALTRTAFTAPARPGFGHASDYSWLCGEVQQTLKGLRLRYAPLDQTDTYGGCVTLLAGAQVDSLRDGQFVRVVGHLVHPESPTAAAAYKVLSVEPASR